MTLSPHFSMIEAKRSVTAVAKGIDNTVPQLLRTNVGRMAGFMECLRALLDDQRITVTSWFRCQSLNDAIGGSQTSAHIKGLAVDWKHAKLPLEEAFARVADSTLPFDQLILEGTKDGAGWIHLGLSEHLPPRRQVLRASGDTLGGPMTFSRVRDADN